MHLTTQMARDGRLSGSEVEHSHTNHAGIVESCLLDGTRSPVTLEVAGSSPVAPVLYARFIVPTGDREGKHFSALRRHAACVDGDLFR